MKNKLHKIILYSAFGVYALAMVYLLFNRAPMPYHMYNLVPLKTIGKYLVRLSPDSYIRSTAVINLFGNIIMFIPLGFFLSAIWKKLRRIHWNVLATAVIITAVELLQVLTMRGTADIDDLILNILGSALGLAVFAVYEKIKNHILNKKSEKQIG